MLATLKLTIRRFPDSSHIVDAELTSDASAAPSQLASNVPVAFDEAALLAVESDPSAYGRALSTQLFADPRLRNGWLKARAFAATGDLQLRLNLDAGDAALHDLRWERLRDPESDQPIALHERVRLVRSLDSSDLTPVRIPPRPNLHALVVVSNPPNLGDFGLAEVDVEGEIARARAALGDIPATILGDHAEASGRATLMNITAALRDAPPIVILVAHGTIPDDTPYVWLEQDDGTADIVTSDTIAETLRRLSVRPLLFVLASCRGAGGGYGDTLRALGPQLAGVGVPAVLAFQGNVAMSTAKALLPKLITELRRDGQIDRAMAAARAALGKRPWWQAVLWLRTDGRLWAEAELLDTRLATRERTLRALLHDHSGFITSRMEAFVGRETELIEIRQRITEKLRIGGYVTITGQAGQGKSSVIARLVADALHGDSTTLREQLLEPGKGVPVCHFIPFSPGPEHQVSLLRNLIARLCLSYDLPDFYATSDSRPALRDYLAAALRDLAKQGKQEVIYIDGLDQIEEDVSGVRDLSFLPEEPPEGIVFVLGTRPNDTLKPLELRKPQYEYWLPTLSRGDFDLILKHRGVALTISLADRFYAAMQENALYLDLVAKELREQESLPPEELIARIADDPDKLFSLTIERLKRQRQYWREILKPTLGLLLTSRAPLSSRALRRFIAVDDEMIREGLQRLGGLIQRDGEGRYGLFHLKLGEFLRQAIFATDEEESYHQRFVDWCENRNVMFNIIWTNVNGDILEQERRSYARQHYITHLAAAKNYEQLWNVVDTGDYSKAKRRHDPSTHSYILDLDIARQAVIDAAADDAEAQARELPRLWRYSLLRCSLSSLADRYPEELFLALVSLSRENEAINLAELLSDPVKKATTLNSVGIALVNKSLASSQSLLQRARMVASDISASQLRNDIFLKLVSSFAHINLFDQARATAEVITDKKVQSWAFLDIVSALIQYKQLESARSLADFIQVVEVRIKALCSLAWALAQSDQVSAAENLLDEIITIADTIPQDEERTAALSDLALAWTRIGGTLAAKHIFTAARANADSILSNEKRAGALSYLAQSLSMAGQRSIAAATFANARSAADAILDSDERSDALASLAVVLAQVERFNDAEATIYAIPEEARKNIAWRDVFNILVYAKKFQRARKAARNISPHQRNTALRELVYIIAQDGQFDDARTITNDIRDADELDAALCSLTNALAHAGRFDDARTTADTITKVKQRAAALSSVASALADSGQTDAAETAFAAARNTADAIPPIAPQANALSSLGLALDLTSQTAAAETAFAAAHKTADAIPVAEQRATALNNLVSALASTRRFDHAFATIDTIPAEGQKAAARSTLVSALVNNGEFELAHSLIEDIPAVSERALALCALAKALFVAGQTQPAEDAFTKAFDISVTIPDVWPRASALRELVKALADCTQYDRACATADMISDERQRAMAFRFIAQTLSHDGQSEAAQTMFTKSRTISNTIRDKWRRTHELCDLAEVLTKIGDKETADSVFSDAFDVAKTSSSKWMRDDAFCILASALSRTARFDRAQTIIDTIDDQLKRDHALCAFASALALDNQFERARATANTISNLERRTEALHTIAAALARAGRFDYAREVANSIPGDEKSASAIGKIISTLASAGLLQKSIASLREVWRKAQTREELLRFFVVDVALINAYPTIGLALMNDFSWVDAQLAMD